MCMNKYDLLLAISKQALYTSLVLLDKAEQHVASGAKTEAELLNASIYPDMYPFVKQIQIITDGARGSLARLSGKERVSMEDTETTIAQLRDRVNKTIEIVNTFTSEDFANADDAKIQLPWMGDNYVKGSNFVDEFAITNMLFHLVTAYNILRMNGVVLGKMDYINKLSMQALEQ